MTKHANRISRAIQTLMLPLALLFLPTGCAPAMRTTAAQPLTAEQMAELWVDPGDIAARDLFNGPGGSEGAPDPTVTYKVTGVDVTGYSAGYDVVDPQGREWKVKLGNEVQPEIVSSRILWAIGFHQPPTYYVSQLSLDGGKPEDQGRSARLRAEQGYKTESIWSWHSNPYVGTQPFKGLLVANLIVNNWDLKPSNNRIYLLTEGAPAPRRRFVVQDLGASLGRTRWPVGNRNDPDAFESQTLIDKVANGVVDFDYHARHDELFEDITPADVVWTCRLLSRMTDEQWNAVFRAASYSDALAKRFITKLKSKIEEGLALEKQASAIP
jgi:hypothetical protein